MLGVIALYLLSCTAQNLLNIALLFTQDLGLSSVLTAQVLGSSVPGWLCIQQSLLGHAFPEGPQPELCILRKCSCVMWAWWHGSFKVLAVIFCPLHSCATVRGSLACQRCHLQRHRD